MKFIKQKYIKHYCQILCFLTFRHLNLENKFIGKALLRLMIFFEKYSYQSSLKNFLTNAFVYLHTLCNTKNISTSYIIKLKHTLYFYP